MALNKLHDGYVPIYLFNRVPHWPVSAVNTCTTSLLFTAEYVKSDLESYQLSAFNTFLMNYKTA